MNLLNLGCDPSLIRNFSTGNCTAEFGAFKYMGLVPKDWYLTPAQISDLLDSLLADNTADAYDERIYLIGNFHTVELAYQDATINTRPDGSTTETRAAVAGWRFIMDKGGICMARALQSISDLQDTFNVFFVSTKNAIVGTQKTVNGEICFAGYDMSMLTAETPQVGQYEENDRYPIMVQLADADQMFVNPMLIGIQVDALVDAMPNITDVFLQPLTALSNTGVVQVAMAAGCGNINLASSGVSSTWTNVNRFVATNYQTGGAITISTVAVNASQSGFTFTFDDDDPDYPASGQYVALTFAPVQTLAGYGLKYFAPYAQNANGVNGVTLLLQVP